jgi:hypothetical protein
MSAPLPRGFASPHPLTAREIIELEIERLIALLDAIDGDPDLEPSLAAPESHPSAHGAILPCRDNDGAQITWSAGSPLDLEDEVDADDHNDNPVTLNPERRSRDRRLTGPSPANPRASPARVRV